MQRIMPGARWREAVKPGTEDRTATRAVGTFDTLVRTWPNRTAMARAIRREQERPLSMAWWTPMVPLGIVEGY